MIDTPEEPQTMDMYLGTLRIEEGSKIIFNPNEEIKNKLMEKGDHREYVGNVLRTVVKYLSTEHFFEKGHEVSITMEIK